MHASLQPQVLSPSACHSHFVTAALHPGHQLLSLLSVDLHQKTEGRTLLRDAGVHTDEDVP